MDDGDCVALLRWMLPRLHLRWDGFRRVRRQVCKRLSRRITELGLAGAADYRAYLEAHPDEWRVADALCTVTISRFYRDKGVFAFLGKVVMPELAQRALAAGRRQFSAWSAGCASGEEPYTLALLWKFEILERTTSLELDILATDIDSALLRRAAAATYPRGCLKDLPAAWRTAAFECVGDEYRLLRDYQENITFRAHDLRAGRPNGPFDLVLCRNLAFTYFDADSQAAAARLLLDCLHDGGALILGAHENLPADAQGFSDWSRAHKVFRKGTDDRLPSTERSASR